jgi:hypothetical protein
MNLYKKLNFNSNFIYIFLFSIILSFIFGFIFDEDSSGGGKIDFIHEYKSFLEFKKGILPALTSLNYESSRTPLFLIINSFNIFATDQSSFRFSNFIFNFLIFFSFFYCLKSQKKFAKNSILIITCILLLSPYFRSSSYWAHQENLPFLFYFLTLALLSIWHKNLNNYFYLKILIIAFVSSLSFYSDQKFIFLSFSVFLMLIFSFNLDKLKVFKIFFIFFLSSLPALYLFYIWGGILPKESQFRIGFYSENISSSLSIIAFYFLPIIFLFIKELINKKFIFKLKKIDLIIFLFILIVNILTIPNFNSPWGQGVIYKLFYLLQTELEIHRYILIFIYLMFIQIFIFKIYFLLRNNMINFIPLLTIILISSLVERTYNEYFDPLIFVLIFTFFKFDKNFMIDKKHLIISYGLFYFSFLIFANLYYNYFNLNVV